MCNRRNKPICQGAILLALVGGLGYTMYLYGNASMDLEISKSETDKYFRQQESLSSQLQVVYEHRARLERSLQKEKTDHRNTKLDFSRKQNDFMLNISRSKHEAMNRFNSLETQYNMLKAQNKELDTDYNRLQQQHTRLSSEHSQLNSQLKRNFQLYKEQKTNEIASLDEEIKTLKQQVVQLRTHLKSKADEVEQYKSSNSRASEANQQYQETITTLQDQLTFYKEKLKKSQLTRDQAIKSVERDGGKTTGSRRQGGNLLDSDKVGVDDQEEKQNSQQENGHFPGVGRSDNRHAVNDSPQEGYHGQRYVPTTALIDPDSDQDDKSRQADENNNEHKQGYSHQRRESDSNREESERNENSQRENEQKNVPLRDSSENRRLEDRDTGVQVVAPTDNSTNKWADIIKAAQQGHAPEEGRKENSDKGEEEEQREDEGNKGKRSKGSDDNYMQEVTEPSRLQERDMQNYNQKQPGGEEKEMDEWNGRPVAQRPVNMDARLQEAQEQYEHRDPDNQQRETIDKDEQEDHDEQDSDLSRKKINKQMAEMQENYNEKLTKEQQQQQQQQQQQEKEILPQEQNSDTIGRSLYRHVAPIPAVQRQDTAEEQSDADNDDEDADTEQDTEEDPDDADEEDMLEPRDSPQEQQEQQQHHQLPPPDLRPKQAQRQPREGRTFERALKSANSNINYRPNE